MQVHSHKFTRTEVRHRSCSLSRNPSICNRAWGPFPEFKLRWVPWEMPTANSPKSFSKIIQSFLFGLYWPVSMECLYSCTSTGDLMFPSLYAFPFAEKSPWGATAKWMWADRMYSVQRPIASWSALERMWLSGDKGDPSHLRSSVGTRFSLGLPIMRCGYIRNRLANSKVQLFTR